MTLYTLFLTYLDKLKRKRLRRFLTVHEPRNTSFPKLGDSRSSQEWHKNMGRYR